MFNGGARVDLYLLKCEFITCTPLTIALFLEIIANLPRTTSPLSNRILPVGLFANFLIILVSSIGISSTNVSPSKYNQFYRVIIADLN